MHLGSGTLLSLGYFDALFIIMCGLYPRAMSEEMASLVSVNTVHAETQQPQNLINKLGLCNSWNDCRCYWYIEETKKLMAWLKIYVLAI